MSYPSFQSVYHELRVRLCERERIRHQFSQKGLHDAQRCVNYYVYEWLAHDNTSCCTLIPGSVVHAWNVCYHDPPFGDQTAIILYLRRSLGSPSNKRLKPKLLIFGSQQLTHQANSDQVFSKYIYIFLLYTNTLVNLTKPNTILNVFKYCFEKLFLTYS